MTKIHDVTIERLDAPLGARVSGLDGKQRLAPRAGAGGGALPF